MTDLVQRPRRELPMLEFTSPAPTAGQIAVDERLAEYRPEAPALPRFFVWTLGCQMNHSDSEEMAGRLLAAGCEEAAALDARGPDRDQ